MSGIEDRFVLSTPVDHTVAQGAGVVSSADLILPQDFDIVFVQVNLSGVFSSADITFNINTTFDESTFWQFFSATGPTAGQINITSTNSNIYYFLGIPFARCRLNLSCNTGTSVTAKWRVLRRLQAGLTTQF